MRSLPSHAANRYRAAATLIELGLTIAPQLIVVLALAVLV
jgi:hypothetical protein